MIEQLERQRGPYPLPPPGRPLRVAFIGQATFFAACSQQSGANGLEPRFFEFRAGANAAALLAGLDAFAPHVAVVFRPEIIPLGSLAELRAATLGFLTEPLPRRSGTHPDLERRLDELRAVHAEQFDRIVSFDPLIADSAEEILPVWRSVPLPVADRFYLPVTRQAGAPRALFIGRSTGHRERMLTPAKHLFDTTHLAFGIHGDELERALRLHDVGINLHNEPYPSFENRVSLHLAAGHLVLSETLSPLHGLEPGIDFLEIDSPHAIVAAIDLLQRFPDIYHRVRVRGRLKAEWFRASRVWPRVVSDLVADLVAFGTDRRSARRGP